MVDKNSGEPKHGLNSIELKPAPAVLHVKANEIRKARRNSPSRNFHLEEQEELSMEFPEDSPGGKRKADDASEDIFAVPAPYTGKRRAAIQPEDEPEDKVDFDELLQSEPGELDFNFDLNIINPVLREAAVGDLDDSPVYSPEKPHQFWTKKDDELEAEAQAEEKPAEEVDEKLEDAVDLDSMSPAEKLEYAQRLENQIATVDYEVPVHDVKAETRKERRARLKEEKAARKGATLHDSLKDAPKDAEASEEAVAEKAVELEPVIDTREEVIQSAADITLKVATKGAPAPKKTMEGLSFVETAPQEEGAIDVTKHIHALRRNTDSKAATSAILAEIREQQLQGISLDEVSNRVEANEIPSRKRKRGKELTIEEIAELRGKEAEGLSEKDFHDSGNDKIIMIAGIVTLLLVLFIVFSFFLA